MTKETDPKWAADQLTEQEAINMYRSKIWEDWTHEQIVRFQLFQHRLAIPFDKFHEAMTHVLGRSVWTHEFAFHDSLVKEYLGEKPMPTMQEIIELIPAEKRIIIST